MKNQTPKVFIVDENGVKEEFAKIKIEFTLDVYLGKFENGLPVLSLKDVEEGLEDMELTQLGSILLENIDLSKTIMEETPADGIHECKYSKAMHQTSPRPCVICGKPETLTDEWHEKNSEFGYDKGIAP